MPVTDQEESKLSQKMNGNYKQEAERLGKELSIVTMQRAKGAMEFTVSRLSASKHIFSHSYFLDDYQQLFRASK